MRTCIHTHTHTHCGNWVGDLPPAGSLPRWPPWPRLSKARNVELVPGIHRAVRAQALGHNSRDLDRKQKAQDLTWPSNLKCQDCKQWQLNTLGYNANPCQEYFCPNLLISIHRATITTLKGHYTDRHWMQTGRAKLCLATRASFPAHEGHSQLVVAWESLPRNSFEMANALLENILMLSSLIK